MSSHVIVTTQTYIQRVQAVALLDPQRVTLTVKNGSGHTKLLIVAVGSVSHTVVQLGFKLHKAFNAIVKLAQDWLAGYKALLAPVVAQVVGLLPEHCSSTAVAAKSTAEMLAIAKSKVPATYNWQAHADRVDALPIGKLRSSYEYFALNPGGTL